MPDNLAVGDGGQSSIKKAGQTYLGTQGDDPFAKRKGPDTVKELNVDTKR